ncbi:MAG: hypothetical protein ACJ0P6_03470, partial [Flavobacteriaceae bacterium]
LSSVREEPFHDGGIEEKNEGGREREKGREERLGGDGERETRERGKEGGGGEGEEGRGMRSDAH